MAKQRRKKSYFLFYLLIVLNIAASGLAVYGLSGQWKIHEESRSTYEDLQQTVAKHSEDLIVNAQAHPEEAEKEEAEDDYVSQGMEAEESDQEATQWFIQLNQPQYSAFGKTAPPRNQRENEEGETQDGDRQGEQAASDAVPTPFATPNPALLGPTLREKNAAGSVSNVLSGQELLRPRGSQTSEPERTDAAMAGAVPHAPVEGAQTAQAPAATGNTLATSVKSSSAPTETLAQTPVPTTEPWMERAVQVNEAHYAVDFEYLQSIYPNMAGWIMQEGTVINYPVMQAEDNEYYLDRLYDGKPNQDGAIFLDCGNSAEFIDANNYIYGHNTKTGDMFGVLSKYQDQAYYDAHPQFTLLTPYSDFCIDIFASTKSLVEDESSWRLKQFKRKADFDEYIADLKAQSFFKTDVTPEWGDQFLVLCTCTNIAHGERYVVYGRMRPIRYGTEETIGITKMEMDALPTQSGMRKVGPLGMMQIYAQNDELWRKLRFETKKSTKERRFGDGGNGPTAVAMAVANLVPTEELTRLRGYAGATTGFTFCRHSVNQYFCTRLHAQYQIENPSEFLRYLPVALASFTTGNNLWSDEARTPYKSGTSMSFLPYIAGVYELDLQVSNLLDDALAGLRDGGMVVCLTSGSRSPFNRGGQYVVLAGMDEQYLYILDPYLRNDYNKTDRADVLEIVTQNVLRVRLQTMDQIGLSAFYILRHKPTSGQS